MPDPNFMVIGAQKGGTSWLARMMRQHPDIHVPDAKELHFFNLRENYAKGLDWYRDQFAGWKGQEALGDFTPNYLWNCPNQQEIEERGVIPNIAENVHRHYPDLRLIVSLRNPVDRAVSAFYHFIRSRSYPPYRRIHEIGHTNGIITMGFYYRYLKEWLEYYPIEKFHFVIYEEDIKQRKLETLRNVFRFLEVDEDFSPENLDKKYNARMGHLYLYLNYYSPLFARIFFRLFRSLKPVDFPRISISEDELSRLNELYKKENQELSKLIGRRLPW